MGSYKLTEEQKNIKSELKFKKQEIQNKIDNLESEIELLNNDLEDLYDSCPHIFAELTKTQIKNEWLVSSKCLICGGNFGNRCEFSPDQVCHYKEDIEGGKLKLINGQVVYLIGYRNDKYMEDECVYCGNPECPQ